MVWVYGGGEETVVQVYSGVTTGGVIPARIASLPKLQVISLSNNNLTGLIPASMFCNVSVDKPSIRNVQLRFTAFTDIVPPVSGKCFSVLQVLDLQQNQIHGDFPLWLTDLATLTALDVSSNRLSGEIPCKIWRLKLMEELKLANNLLCAVFPSEIKELVNLRVLNLEGDLFSGEIPKFLSELTGLKMLYLGGNRFNGSVPSSCSNLTQLETLSLRGNSLRGTLPEDLMSMSSLVTLDLSDEILVSIGNLKALSILNLSGNGFCGRRKRCWGMKRGKIYSGG
ncbi:putative non-specific serine/threonine protein kinase [Helianthus anomalus]